MKILRLSRFWRLAIGLLFLGVGQRLLFTGAISPVIVEEGLSLILTLFSLNRNSSYFSNNNLVL